MGIGLSIFLIALGAIIAFGVQDMLTWLSLDVVGWVLMLSGITLLALTFYFWKRRRRSTRVVSGRPYYSSSEAAPPPR